MKQKYKIKTYILFSYIILGISTFNCIKVNGNWCDSIDVACTTNSATNTKPQCDSIDVACTTNSATNTVPQSENSIFRRITNLYYNANSTITDIAFDTNYNMYIATYTAIPSSTNYTNTILKIPAGSPPNSQATIHLTYTADRYIRDIEFDYEDNLYISNYSKIQKVEKNTTNIVDWVTTSAQSLKFDKNNNLYFLNYSGGGVYRIVKGTTIPVLFYSTSNYRTFFNLDNESNLYTMDGILIKDSSIQQTQGIIPAKCKDWGDYSYFVFNSKNDAICLHKKKPGTIPSSKGYELSIIERSKGANLSQVYIDAKILQIDDYSYNRLIIDKNDNIYISKENAVYIIKP